MVGRRGIVVGVRGRAYGHAVMVASKHWKEALGERPHKFKGALQGILNPYDSVDVLSCDENGPPRKVEMRILPYLASPGEYLNSDGCGERLIGNAISIPVLQFCLSELTKVFGRRDCQGYDYKYAWEDVLPATPQVVRVLWGLQLLGDGVCGRRGRLCRRPRVGTAALPLRAAGGLPGGGK